MPEYISVSQYAQKYGLDVGNVRRKLGAGKIPGIKIGNQWAIEKDTPPPADGRVKTGKYKNWRNKGKAEKV